MARKALHRIAATTTAICLAAFAYFAGGALHEYLHCIDQWATGGPSTCSVEFYAYPGPHRDAPLFGIPDLAEGAAYTTEPEILGHLFIVPITFIFQAGALWGSVLILLGAYGHRRGDSK